MTPSYLAAINEQYHLQGMNKLVIIMALLYLLPAISSAYELLSDVPVTFKINGNVSYTPTSGGISIPGYKLKIGFSRFQWIGVKFMSLTSRSTYDVMVVQRDTTAVGGYYKTTVKDYFVSSARQDKLLADSNNNMDKETVAYDQSNYFEAEIYRTKGDTQGEDWEGGQFVQICFYTSTNVFSQNDWTSLTESCYGYDVSQDYVSTFRGRYITPMTADGLGTSVYGGIEGPVLQMQLFWYLTKPSLSSSHVYIRSGDKISDDLGYDYYKCGSGDHFGHDTDSLTPDSLWSGYNDGECVISSSSVGTKISYHRNIYTFDQFDSTLYNQTQICLRVGSNEACQAMTLSILFPVMTVDSALVVWHPHLQASFLLLVALLQLWLQ